MVRNLIFAVMFGLFFYAVFAIALVPSTDFPDYQSTLWIAPVCVVGLLLLRLFSILLEKANRAGERMGEKAFASAEEKAAIDARTETELPKQETYLQMLVGLYFVGPFIATGLALCGPIAAFFIAENLGLRANLPENRFDGVMVILIAVIGFIWLFILEKWGRTTITFPIIPIPLTWLLFPLLGYGGYLLFTGTSIGL